MEGVKHTKYSGNCRQHILQFLVETDFFVHKNLTFCLASTECTTDRADHTRFTISTFHTSTLGSPRLLILPATGTRGFACSRAFIFRKTRFRKKAPYLYNTTAKREKTKECINFTPLSAKTISLNSYVFMSWWQSDAWKNNWRVYICNCKFTPPLQTFAFLFMARFSSKNIYPKQNKSENVAAEVCSLGWTRFVCRPTWLATKNESGFLIG